MKRRPDEQDAVAAFLAQKGVTQCPTAACAPTSALTAEDNAKLDMKLTRQERRGFARTKARGEQRTYKRLTESGKSTLGRRP